MLRPFEIILVAPPTGAVTEVIVKLSPSGSLSFASTSITIGTKALVLAESLFAVGGSFAKGTSSGPNRFRYSELLRNISDKLADWNPPREFRRFSTKLN